MYVHEHQLFTFPLRIFCLNLLPPTQTCEEMFQKITGNSEANLKYSVEVGIHELNIHVLQLLFVLANPNIHCGIQTHFFVFLWQLLTLCPNHVIVMWSLLPPGELHGDLLWEGEGSAQPQIQGKPESQVGGSCWLNCGRTRSHTYLHIFLRGFSYMFKQWIHISALC